MAYNTNFEDFSEPRRKDVVEFPFLESYPYCASLEKKVLASVLHIYSSVKKNGPARYKNDNIYLSVFETFWHLRKLPETHPAYRMFQKVFEQDHDVFIIKPEYFVPMSEFKKKEDCIDHVKNMLVPVIETLTSQYGNNDTCYKYMPLWIYQYSTKMVVSCDEYPALVRYASVDPSRALFYECAPAYAAVFQPPEPKPIFIADYKKQEGEDDSCLDFNCITNVSKDDVEVKMQTERKKTRAQMLRQDQVLKVYFRHVKNKVLVTYRFKDLKSANNSKTKQLVSELVRKVIKTLN